MKEELENDAVCGLFHFNYREYLIKDALEGFGQVIHTYKYADDLVLLAKKKRYCRA